MVDKKWPTYGDFDEEDKAKQSACQVNYITSFDQHDMDSLQVAQELGKVTGSKEDGWVVESIILFGTQNAFGVKSDFFFHYTASVDEDDNCGPIIPLEFGPYTR